MVFSDVYIEKLEKDFDSSVTPIKCQALKAVSLFFSIWFCVSYSKK